MKADKSGLFESDAANSKMKAAKPPELCRKQHEFLTNRAQKMEAILIINSALVMICLYFIKDFHRDFKNTANKVAKLETKIEVLSAKLGHPEQEDK